MFLVRRRPPGSQVRDERRRRQLAVLGRCPARPPEPPHVDGRTNLLAVGSSPHPVMHFTEADQKPNLFPASAEEQAVPCPGRRPRPDGASSDTEARITSVLQRSGASLFYEGVGNGTPVLTTHGRLENASYWSLPGIAARLSLHSGWCLSTCGAADDARRWGQRLRSRRPGRGSRRHSRPPRVRSLHLVTHTTGGMVGMRYAIADDQDSSASCPLMRARPRWSATPRRLRAAGSAGRGADIAQLRAALRAAARRFPLPTRRSS